MLPVIAGVEGMTLSPRERELFSRLQPAGYILFSRNIEDTEQVRELTDELRQISCDAGDPIIAIDQEGGRVVRTAAIGVHLPSAASLAQTRSSHSIRKAAAYNARSLLALGINTNLAPLLDLASGNANALPSRCWGTDTQDVISYAGVWNRMTTHCGIMTCGKHFPGMGAATCDPHSDLPVLHGTRDDFLHGAGLPFKALMPDLPALMIAHLLIPEIDNCHPSSLSYALVHEFLRNQLGFKGVVFTDDLCMGAIAQKYGPEESLPMALRAGCDLPLVCHQSCEYLESIAAAVKTLPNEILSATHNRILQFRMRNNRRPMMHPIRWRKFIQSSSSFTSRIAKHHLLANVSTLPQISYILTSYNSSAYIRHAVESALSQDYPGELEFVFSDDCSTDDTYDAIRRYTAAYNGPHRIITTQTPRHLGHIGNINHAIAMATGAWILCADADEISALDRCSLIAKAIIENPGCTYIVTGIKKSFDTNEITTDGSISFYCGMFATASVVSLSNGFIPPIFPGANTRFSYKVWHISVFRTFGPLPDDAHYVDDLSCYYRANFIGQGVYLDSPAIWRRESNHVRNSQKLVSRSYKEIIREELFFDSYNETSARSLALELLGYRNYAAKSPSPHYDFFLKAIEKNLSNRQLLSNFRKRSMFDRINTSRRLGYKGFHAIIHSLPLPIYAFILAIGRKYKWQGFSYDILEGNGEKE